MRAGPSRLEYRLGELAFVPVKQFEQILFTKLLNCVKVVEPDPRRKEDISEDTICLEVTFIRMLGSRLWMPPRRRDPLLIDVSCVC